MAFFDKIKQGLAKTKANIDSALNSVFAVFREVDEDLLEELLDALIMSDLGASLSQEIIDELRERAKLEKLESEAQVKEALVDILKNKMTLDNSLKLTTKPSVIMVVGVNGVGKTTTIGKIGQKLTQEGKKVLFVAADTFRAAAADQLTIWADRCGAQIVRHSEGADPAAVIFDGITAAKARGVDVVICDTAGRLHNKQNLMRELEKMNRIIDRELPDGDKETLLVVDATTGQNALSQAEQFGAVTQLSGVVVTKLDGTAKGGVVAAISAKMNIPIKFIGVGEKADDLLEFEPENFLKAFFE
ncbi:MAG: signal recognition particle-docking protein FtsY [Ruminococcaceae bacterium]|nr:signal recognition particle-docking protein FtsY [Oscillospiraceae bacterium]